MATGNEAGLLFPVIKKSGGGSVSKRQGSGTREQGLGRRSFPVAGDGVWGSGVIEAEGASVAGTAGGASLFCPTLPGGQGGGMGEEGSGRQGSGIREEGEVLVSGGRVVEASGSWAGLAYGAKFLRKTANSAANCSSRISRESSAAGGLAGGAAKTVCGSKRQGSGTREQGLEEQWAGGSGQGSVGRGQNEGGRPFGQALADVCRASFFV